MLAFHAMGVPELDYGNNIRQIANDVGVADAFTFPGFVPVRQSTNAVAPLTAAPSAIPFHFTALRPSWTLR